MYRSRVSGVQRTWDRRASMYWPITFEIADMIDPWRAAVMSGPIVQIAPGDNASAPFSETSGNQIYGRLSTVLVVQFRDSLVFLSIGRQMSRSVGWTRRVFAEERAY
jgi:hypothetical protein